MGQYSIKDLEQLSGIKAHTIRIWEKRYQLIKPGRTQTNIRMYSDEDLRRLLNISILSRHGFRISHIAAFCEEEISEKVLHLSQRTPSHHEQVEALIVAMIELDETRFSRILSNSMMKIGFEDTYIQVIAPFLEKVGILWQAGTIEPAREHFITNLIRQRLIVAIDGVQNTLAPGAKKFLLFMQEGDFHEIGLLFFHYMLARRGQRVLYLGSSLPGSDLPGIYASYQPDYLITLFVSYINEEFLDSYTRFLQENQVKAFFAGRQITSSMRQFPPAVTQVHTPQEFSDWLKQISS